MAGCQRNAGSGGVTRAHVRTDCVRRWRLSLRSTRTHVTNSGNAASNPEQSECSGMLIGDGRNGLGLFGIARLIGDMCS
jgi:hypothetical protein